ncbi:hypothetical protein V1L52_12065 [Treponema sp. HNW]|uniref:hypothetical protein n=1 Tax=Treponema sp. HNW TaxID=3116654 RepID=UPI003D11B18D
MPECLHKKNLKNILFFLRVLCCVFPLISPVRSFAQIRPAGQAPFNKKLSVIQTEYFDFIFPEESARSARSLASRADGLYRDICSRFESPVISSAGFSRIPVFITRETEVLNGYFTALPYNRIVLYDSLPPRSFAVFSDTLLSVFYHELVHAVSLNIKSPFWQGFSRVAGDVYSPSLLLHLPTSFIEGAAVSFESIGGQGRLNDAYSMHVVRQAKIEGKFPDWRKAAGSYTAYTDGSLPYMFGAAFARYLQKTYGMHLYAEFWKQSGRSHVFKLSAGIFKKVYGVSLNRAWKDFEQSLEVDTASDSEVTALFPENDTENKDAVKGRHLYQSLTFAEDTLAWYDEASSSVWKVHVNADGSITKKPVFLYMSDLRERLSFSRGGDFLVSSGLQSSPEAQSVVSIYDVKKKRIVLQTEGLRSAAFIRTKNEQNLLAGLRREGDSFYIILYNISSAVPDPVHKIPVERTVFPFDICDAGDGRLVCIMKERRNGYSDKPFSAEGEVFFYRLFFYDIQSGRSYSYALSPVDGIFPAFHSLSVHEGKAFFSCSLGPDFQPVLAAADLSAFTEPAENAAYADLRELPVLSVQKAQYSGGVFSPVPFNGGTAFISRFYESRRLSVFSREQTNNLFNDAYRFVFTPAKQEIVREDEAFAAELPFSYTRPYRPFSYLKKGTVVPFAGFLNAAFFDRYAPDTQPLGLSAFSGDPAERFLLAAGAGMDPINRNYNINAFASAASGRFGFAAGFYTQADLKKSALEKAAVKLSADFELPAGIPFTYIYGANSAYFFYTLSKTPFTPAGYLLENKTELALRFAKRTGTGVYETLGIKAGFFVFAYKNGNPLNDKNPWIGAHAVEVAVRLPFLLPFKNPRGFTLNLPTAFNAAYYINALRVWELQSTAVLFSYNMQTPLPFIPIFIREITLDGGADYTLFYNHKSFLYVHSSLFFVCSLNSGSATGVPFNLGVSLKWIPPETGPDDFRFSLKFNLKL